MDLNKNNNHRILFALAKNNLLSKKLAGFFSAVSVFLAVALVSTISLFILGNQCANQRILSKMQHVRYREVTAAQAEEMGADERIEVSVPYKFCDQKFRMGGIEYQFAFFGSTSDAINTYLPVEGAAPQAYNEIVVDKAFAEEMKIEGKPGTAITLDVGNMAEEFVISGITDSGNAALPHTIYTSKEFAEKSPVMETLSYEALVKFYGADDMSDSDFTTILYQVAADYGIERPNVNPNGKLKESLQSGNAKVFTVLFVSGLLFAAGSIVIYSIFYLSVLSRVQQIGQFQTIGMTPKQVRKMIRREGLLLSMVSIPLGLLLSGILSYIFIPTGWSFQNFGLVSLAVGIAAGIIVQIAIRKPAAIASKISPVEASKSIGSEADGRHKNKTHRRLTPYALAGIEFRSNRKKWWFTTASLAFGGILFMVASSWNASWDKESYSRQSYFKNAEYYITYLYSHSSPKTYGITEMQLEGHLSSDLMQKIRQIPHVKEVQADDCSATGVIEYQGRTFTQPFYCLTEKDSEYFELNAEGNLDYDYMAQNDAILITDCTFTESFNGVVFSPGEKLTVRYFDGEEHQIELEIAAVSTETVFSDTNRSNFCMTDATMTKLWKTMNTTASVTVSVEDYEKNGLWVEQEIRALTDEYEDLDLLTLREQLIVDSAEIQSVQTQIYGISLFLMLFSIFNLINTVISSVTARKRELSMLESIGMEQKQICKMLLWESFFLALPNLFVTLTAGTFLGAAFIHMMKKTAVYLQYRFPLPAVLFYIGAMVFIPMFLSFCCLKQQNKISLVERIKVSN